jgi:ABC-type nitrate/sulfonate/bicarbonate transport system permease component
MTVLTTAPRRPSRAPAPPQQPSSFREWVHEHSRFFYGTLGLVLLFTAWQVVTSLGFVDVTIASSPSRIARAEVDLFRSGEIWAPLAGTASEVGLGLLISLIVGIPLGLVLGRVSALYDMTEPIVNILNSVPYVLFLPIIIFWFGIGQTSRVLIVIWAASIPLIINTSAGVRNLNPDYARVSRVFCAGRLLFYRSVLLPATLPYILTGIRLSVGRALVAAIVAEFFLAGGGLGYLVQLSTANFDMDTAMAGIAVVAVAAVALTKLIGALERRYTHWS